MYFNSITVLQKSIEPDTSPGAWKGNLAQVIASRKAVLRDKRRSLTLNAIYKANEEQEEAGVGKCPRKGQGSWASKRGWHFAYV